MGIERSSWIDEYEDFRQKNPPSIRIRNSQNPKGENCPFNPERRGKEGSCRRGGCKYFEDCPTGEQSLQPGDEIIVSPPPDPRAGNTADLDRPLSI